MYSQNYNTIKQTMSKTLKQLSAYGVGFQIKVLNSLLKNKEFLININDILEAESFDNPAHKWIVEEILLYYSKYHTTPSLDFLSVEVKKIENEVLRVSIIEQLKEAYKITNDDKEFVELEFANFCRNQQLKKALFQSVELYEKGDIESIWGLMDRTRKAGTEKNIGHEYNKDIESRYRNEERLPIATGWAIIDELLGGGLGCGDLGLIFGNPGGGKSWCLVAMAANAVKMGYNVIYYTLELSEAYVGKRFDACFTQIETEKLAFNREKVEATVNQLEGNLIVKEYSPGKASISTIEGHIQKCTDLEVRPDIVMIDYVDLLKSKKTAREKKDEIDDIYTATKGLARDLKIPIWTVSQVNRMGAKDDIIEADKAAGSYDKIMIADFAMSLSRKRQDKVGGTGRFHIMKNRYGMDGMTYGGLLDTAIGAIEITSSELDESVFSPPGSTPPAQGNTFANFNKDERDILSKKFFQLTQP
jgi:replicative DNA helicase